MVKLVPAWKLLIAASLSLTVLPALAQGSSLPPTNMGRYIHQPGDNQYSPQTQAARHAAAGPRAPMGVAKVTYVPTPRIPKPDITLEPIAADEPVVPAGFPPMPDHADLPVPGSWARPTAAGSTSGAGQNAGSAPAGAMPASSVHQHYQHVPAGAYMSPNEQAAHGYYRAQRAGDIYAANGARQNISPTQQALNAMGKEPHLDKRADQPIVPEAPTPVAVKQATTQDLSLPDDEFSYSKPKGPSQTSMMFKQMGRQMLMTPMMQMSGLTSGMMSKMVHF